MTFDGPRGLPGPAVFQGTLAVQKHYIILKFASAERGVANGLSEALWLRDPRSLLEVADSM